MVSDEQGRIYELAYAEAGKTLDEQSSRLDQLRLRMMAILTSATTSSAFLVGVVMDAADTDQRWWYWTAIVIGVLLYGYVLVSTVWCLRPRHLWHKSFSSKTIIEGYADHPSPATLAETHKTLALFADENVTLNEQQLGRMGRVLERSLYAFVVDLIVWAALAARVG